jgi:hypothetical protein
MNDLEYTRAIDISNAPLLKTASFPKLSYVNDLTIIGVNQTDLKFPSLKNTSTMNIKGNIYR